MKIYNLKSWFLMAVTILFVVGLNSCTKNFLDKNTNPSQVKEGMLGYDNLSVGGFFLQMQQNVFTLDVNVYQVSQNLIGDIYSGYMAASGNWFSSRNNSNYALIPDWNGSAFNVGFTKVMPAWKQIITRGGGANPAVPAIATIIKVAAMQRVTDIYGPIPYTKFGSSSVTTPYDSQEAVYDALFADLNSSIATLTTYIGNFPNSKPLQKYDLIYGGNAIEWVKFANSLKLRMAVRITYANPAKAKKYAEEAVNHSIGVFTTNQDNAILKSGGGIIVNNPLKYIWSDYGDIRMGASMESYLTGFNDPRISKYFSLSTLTGLTSSYKGIRNGAIITDKSKYIPFSAPAVNPSTPVKWMLTSEVFFLKAEGAIRGWNMGGTAQSLYESGVRTSFEYLGAGDATNYLNGKTVPSAYIDPVNAINNATPSSTLIVKWNEIGGFEEKLERIITQKWIGGFPDGQEAWSEFRRTRYPEIFTVSNNFSGGIINTNTQIRRIPFPNGEYNNNAAEVAKAISLLGGSDNGGTKLWWDKKP